MTTPAAARATHDEDGRAVRVYPIPDPATGEVVNLPNISSVIDVLQTFGLVDWKLRMAAVGIVSRLDIQAAIATATTMEGGRDRNRVIADAVDLAIDHGQTIEPGRGYLANDFGSAIHLLTEQIDARRVSIMELPASIAEHAARYAQLVDEQGFEIVDSEFTVYGSAGYAGTGDRIIRFPEIFGSLEAVFDVLDLGRGCFVADIKTGKVKETAAMQLAALAHGTTIFDASTRQHRPLPDDIRTDIGFVLHLTAGSAELVPVDLDKAWPAFVGALAVKTFVDSKPLHQPLVARPKTTGLVDVNRPRNGAPDGRSTGAPFTTTPTAGAPVDVPDAEDPAVNAARTGWLTERVVSLIEHDGETAEIVWPPDVPTFSQARLTGHLFTAAELVEIERAVDAAERDSSAPFPDVDPTDPSWHHVTPDDPRVIEITKRFEALPRDFRDHAATSARVAGARKFSQGAGTEACLSIWLGILADIEPKAAARSKTAANAVGVLVESGVDTDALLAAVGNYVDNPTGWQVDRLDDLADCCSAGCLVVNEDQSIGIDPDQVLERWNGSKRTVLAAAKTIAKTWARPAPARADDALADPLMAAALYLVDIDDAA